MLILYMSYVCSMYVLCMRIAWSSRILKLWAMLVPQWLTKLSRSIWKMKTVKKLRWFAEESPWVTFVLICLASTLNHSPTTLRPHPYPTPTPPRPHLDPTSTPPRPPPRPHPDPTPTPPRPHPDPTPTPPRPHLDPTSTPPRPHLDPTSTPPKPHPDPYPTSTPPHPDPDPTSTPPRPPQLGMHTKSLGKRHAGAALSEDSSNSDGEFIN